MKSLLLCSVLLFLGSVSYSKCVNVVPGKSIAQGKKSVSFKNKFCFKVKNDIFTQGNSIDDLGKKLNCSTHDPVLEKKRWYLQCPGLEVEVKGKPSDYKVSGLRIKPFEPENL